MPVIGFSFRDSGGSTCYRNVYISNPTNIIQTKVCMLGNSSRSSGWYCSWHLVISQGRYPGTFYPETARCPDAMRICSKIFCSQCTIHKNNYLPILLIITLQLVYKRFIRLLTVVLLMAESRGHNAEWNTCFLALNALVCHYRCLLHFAH